MMDLRNGYNNIHMAEEDEWKAAFKTSIGTYQPRVMYFGLCNSPSTFQRAMDRILRPVTTKYPGDVFVYMDDIMVATTGDLPRHRQIVHELLDLLEKESFFLKPAKCKFEQTRVEYLGLILDGPQI